MFHETPFPLRPLTLAMFLAALLGFAQARAAADAAAPLPAIETSAASPGGLAESAAVLADAPAPQAAVPEAADKAAPSPNAMANLVNLLVSQRVITREAGDGLIRQAEQEADIARAQLASTQAAAERALAAPSAPAPAPASPPTLASDDDLQVDYVPIAVKNQIRDEVTQDVLKHEHDQYLAVKSDTPDWVKRFKVHGDLRVRYQGDFYPSGNALGEFNNYNAVNTGSGYVMGSPQFPQYNVNQDRERFRLRARVGAEIDLGEGFTLGMRVATGSDNSPVSENQTLGAANSAQGGNFGKYQLWLDRAFLRYEFGGEPDRNVSLTVGRFDNPFFHTSMTWADDLAFDGAVAQARYAVADGVTPFLVAGAFPVFNTDLNFSTNQTEKFASEDKYLLAAQAGVDWTINKDFSVKAGAAYYYFENLQGKVSDPIAHSADPGNTDDSRPAFAQNGNTYIALRNYQDPANPTNAGTTQYFGLATPFHELALTARADYGGFDPFHVWLTGELVKNLAFDRSAIVGNGSPNFPGPVNNLNNDLDTNSFFGGDTGWIVRANVGDVVLAHRWDWNVFFSYRHVESDATVDGFTDPDFGGSLAGTNLKGYTVGGNLALSSRVWATLSWMSADAVAGPTYRNDLIQFDLNAKF